LFSASPLAKGEAEEENQVPFFGRSAKREPPRGTGRKEGGPSNRGWAIDDFDAPGGTFLVITK